MLIEKILKNLKKSLTLALPYSLSTFATLILVPSSFKLKKLRLKKLSVSQNLISLAFSADS